MAEIVCIHPFAGGELSCGDCLLDRLRETIGEYGRPGEDLVGVVLPRILSALRGNRAEAEIARAQAEGTAEASRRRGYSVRYMEDREKVLQAEVTDLRIANARLSREAIGALLPPVPADDQTKAIVPTSNLLHPDGSLIVTRSLRWASWVNDEDQRDYLVAESLDGPVRDLIIASVNAMAAAAEVLGVDPATFAQAMGGGELARVILRATRVQDLQAEVDRKDKALQNIVNTISGISPPFRSSAEGFALEDAKAALAAAPPASAEVPNA